MTNGSCLARFLFLFWSMNIRELKVPGVKNIDETILRHGVHIASRRGLFCEIALFQVQDYYVEMFYDAKSKEVSRAKTFTDVSLLEPYLKHIDISGILN